MIEMAPAPERHGTADLWSRWSTDQQSDWFVARGLIPPYVADDPDFSHLPLPSVRTDVEALLPHLSSGLEAVLGMVTNGGLAALADRLHILAPMEDDYHYHHFGSALFSLVGQDWRGRRLTDLITRTPFAPWFWCLYTTVRRSARPLYAENISVPGFVTNTWVRLILPITTPAGEVEAMASFAVYVSGAPTWPAVLPRGGDETDRLRHCLAHQTMVSAGLRRMLKEPLQEVDELMQSGPIALARLSADGQRVVTANYRMREVLAMAGLQSNCPASALFADPTVLTTLLAQLDASSGTSARLDGDLVTANGPRPVEFTLSRTVHSGSDGLALWVVDLSDRVALQRRLTLALAEAEDLNRQKNRLFSIVAHDLTNGLHGLIGWSEVLETAARKSNATELADIAGQLTAAADRTHTLVANLLAWARSQLHGPRLDCADHVLRRITRDALVTVRPVAEAKGLTIIERGLDAAVRTDRGVLTTVLRNLVGNAVKFTPSGGEVRIIATSAGQTIDVAVSDTGVGLSAEQIAAVLGGTWSTPGTAGETGSGLGLQLCRQFLADIGSTLCVESRPAEGATFRFSLPAAGVRPS